MTTYSGAAQTIMAGLPPSTQPPPIASGGAHTVVPGGGATGWSPIPPGGGSAPAYGIAILAAQNPAVPSVSVAVAPVVSFAVALLGQRLSKGRDLGVRQGLGRRQGAVRGVRLGHDHVRIVPRHHAHSGARDVPRSRRTQNLPVRNAHAPRAASVQPGRSV